jgi:hypothetical protein
LRDPVEGGGSSITPVGPLITGRQQVSLGNYLPGFGTTLISGPGISTVVTTPELGGHSARARESFTKPLPEGTPGKVTIFDGQEGRLATKKDAKAMRSHARSVDEMSIIDTDSALLHQFGYNIPTTGSQRYRTIAKMIDESNSHTSPRSDSTKF